MEWVRCGAFAFGEKSSNCRTALLHVGGVPTAHGRPPRLVSPPAGENLKYTLEV